MARDRENFMTACLEHYRFGAVIEVTNGLCSPHAPEEDFKKAYQGKVDQVERARRYLQNLANVRILTGLAYASLTRLPFDVTTWFLIRSQQYDPRRVLRTLKRIRDNDVIRDSSREIADRILHIDCDEDWPITRFVKAKSQNEVARVAKKLGLEPNFVLKNMPHLRCIAMELYFTMLFDDQLLDKVVIPRQKFTYEGKKTDFDLAIMCGKNQFYEALERLDKNRHLVVVKRR